MSSRSSEGLGKRRKPTEAWGSELAEALATKQSVEGLRYVDWDPPTICGDPQTTVRHSLPERHSQ